MKKKKLNTNIREVFWLYFILFVILQIYLLKFFIIDSKDVARNPNNPRLSMLDKSIKRGDIISSDEVILATSYKDGEEGYKRTYNFGKEYVHVLGNITRQKSGVEANYNYKLQRLFFDMSQRLNNIIFDSELEGNSAVLTLNSKLQEFVYKELGTKKGAIVVTEPQTGKILAMVSYPNYEPNQIEVYWDSLISDEENTPLINRASKGLYPPGSVFKMVSALEIIRNVPDYENIYFECTGETTINGMKISCFNNHVHGSVNLEKAITYSCNTYFANMSDKINKESFKETCESLYFNKSYGYPLESNKSRFSLNQNSSNDELIHTLIGQGKTLVTPLHTALITSSIANGGTYYEPYVVDHFLTTIETKTEKNSPKKLKTVMTEEEANILKNMMRSVVTEGTGREANVEGLYIAGKTGTAENATEKDHSLFTAFAPLDDPKIAVTVVLENYAPDGSAVPLGRNIIKYYLESVYQ